MWNFKVPECSGRTLFCTKLYIVLHSTCSLGNYLEGHNYDGVVNFELKMSFFVCLWHAIITYIR